MPNTRSHTISRVAKNGGELVVDMAFASEVPYERWWGIEILDMAESSVRLSRLMDGAPLLYNHNWNDLRGTHVPASIHIGEDRVLRGQVRITDATQAGRDAIGLVGSGVLTKASVGYVVHKVIEQSTQKTGDQVEVVSRELDGSLFERVLTRCEEEHRGDLIAFRRDLDASAGQFNRSPDEPTIYRVVDWEPMENSLVTVPADNSVGVGRSVQSTETKINIEIDVAKKQDKQATPVQIIRAVSHAGQPAEPKGKAMDAVITAPAGAAAEDKQPTAMEFEQQRRSAIVNLCKANSIDERVQINWVTRGTPLDTIAKEILEIVQDRSKIETSASSLGLSRKETNQYSIVRVLRALHFGARDKRVMDEAKFEIECSEQVSKQLNRGSGSSYLVPAEVLTRPVGSEAATRAMATQPGAKGGYFVNVENMGFIDILRNRSVAMRMGSRQLSGLVGNVMFPRQTGKPSVTWQGGEGTSITAADQTLGQLSMTPKTCIVITDVSEQLLRQASPSAESFIMGDLAADVAIDGVDNAVINGTGGAQPLGIKNTTGITSGQDAASATYAKVLAFVSTAGALNAIRGNPGFVTTTAGAAKLMQVQRFTSTDTPVWTGNMMDGQLVGFNAMSSEQLASGNLIFGSWDEVVIGDWGVLELALDNGGTRFNQGQVGIRALWMVDVLLRYPQAFVVSVNLS